MQTVHKQMSILYNKTATQGLPMWARHFGNVCVIHFAELNNAICYFDSESTVSFRFIRVLNCQLLFKAALHRHRRRSTACFY